MGKLIFIFGGARSGKSGFAVKLAKELKQKTVFVATAEALDEEMKKRIKKHRLSRPRSWKVVEESRDVGAVLSKLKYKCGVVLIDCAALLVSNLLADGLTDKGIEKRIGAIINAARKNDFTVILVSNEVGLGVVPANPLARRFRDLLGLANQAIARKADEVILMQAGIPIKIKER